MAVSVDSGRPSTFPNISSKTRVLPGANAQRIRYVPPRGGRRVLINAQTGDPLPNPITVVLNWTAGLKK